MMENCFYIPAVNLMHIKVTDTIKALCYGTTRGFFETSQLDTMLSLIDELTLLETVKLVEEIDKVKMRDGRIVYRQRIYFTSLETIIKLCKKLGFGFNLTDDVHITGKSMKIIQKDLPYLYKYANDLNIDVDDWLILVFRYYCFVYLQKKNMLDLSGIDESYFAEIEVIYGLLNRAPYFLSVCDIAKHRFTVLQYVDIENEHLFTALDKATVSFYNYGFTNLNVLEDKKKGMFCRK